MNKHLGLQKTLRLAALAMALLCQAAFAAEPTAFELIKAGNDYVGKDSRDKVVQIRSEKSIGSLFPTIWWVVYYDADATFKSTEVKFGAGQKLAVSRPLRMIEYIKAENIFDPKKLHTDSNKAIQIASAQPLLKNITLRATQLSLNSRFKFDPSLESPVWKVRLWAARLKNPNDDTSIGDVYISAADGTVLKVDLHIDRVD
jgi:hypothetical protein